MHTHVIYSELRNAFLIVLGPYFDFRSQKASFPIAFIRYSANGFCVLERLNFPLFYNGLARFAKVQKVRKLLYIHVMLFGCFRSPFAILASRKLHFLMVL